MYELSPESCTLLFGEGYTNGSDTIIQKRIDRTVTNLMSKIRSYQLHLLDANYVLIPVSCNRHHSLFVIVDPIAAVSTIYDKLEEDNIRTNKCKILLFNSLNKAIPPFFAEKIFKTLKLLLKTIVEKTSVVSPGEVLDDWITTETVNCPQQQNIFDCGIYVLKFVELFFQNLPKVCLIEYFHDHK